MHSMPQKVDFKTFDSIEEADQTFFPKITQLIVMDYNVLDKISGKNDKTRLFTNKKLTASKAILLYNRKSHVDKDKYEKLGITHFIVKPFLPEELIELIKEKLGYKK